MYEIYALVADDNMIATYIFMENFWVVCFADQASFARAATFSKESLPTVNLSEIPTICKKCCAD